MVRLIVSKKADADIDSLFESGDAVQESSAALILVLLEQWENDDVVLENLCIPSRYGEYRPPFEVKRFEAFYKTGRNIFIVRIYDDDGALLPYRVLIGFHAQKQIYYVFTIINREINYDINHPDIKSIIQQYDNEYAIPIY